MCNSRQTQPPGNIVVFVRLTWIGSPKKAAIWLGTLVANVSLSWEMYWSFAMQWPARSREWFIKDNVQGKKMHQSLNQIFSKLVIITFQMNHKLRQTLQQIHINPEAFESGEWLTSWDWTSGDTAGLLYGFTLNFESFRVLRKVRHDEILKIIYGITTPISGYLQLVNRAHLTNLELKVLPVPLIVYERGTRALNCKREHVFVPWAQLHSLMVCTGESLQWLPPHMPLNTSGHMVCLSGRNRVSWINLTSWAMQHG